MVRQGPRFISLQADDGRLVDGFHAYEATAGLRWTDGCAALPQEAFASFVGEIEVVLTLAATIWYPEDGDSERCAAG